MLQMEDKRRLIALELMDFVTIATLSLKQWVVISTTVHVKKLAHHWLTTKSWEGWKKGNKTKCAKNISNRKDIKLLKGGSAIAGNYTERMRQWKIIFEQVSPISDLSAKNDLCMRLRVEGCLVTFIPEHLKAYFVNFPPIFKNTVVSRNDIGDLMKEYAEKEGIMSQPKRMLISSFHLKNGTIITHLLLYYLHLGLECTEIHQFIQYTPKKCFSWFVQSAVNARRQGDENPNSSVVAETMKLLANSAYGYQIMDRSRHTATKHLNVEKTHSANNIKLFKRLNFITDQWYEVKLIMSEIEHREPIIVGFFILQYA